MCLSLADPQQQQQQEGAIFHVPVNFNTTKTTQQPPELASLDNSEMWSSRNTSLDSLVDYGVAEEEAAALLGKRRKVSRADSPSSSVFDVASLVEAIHREVDGSNSTPLGSSSPLRMQGEDDDGDTFDFIDISDMAPTEELDVPSLDGLDISPSPMRPLSKRGSLGKRSRGLVRSQKGMMDLCHWG